jgi:hypothetical protein
MWRPPLDLCGVASSELTEILRYAIAELHEALVPRLRFGRKVFVSLNQADSGFCGCRRTTVPSTTKERPSGRRCMMSGLRA